jgi:hypothetical protein
MKTLTRFSMVMIAIPLIATLWSARWMITFVQPERAQIAAGTLHFMFSYENFVHEAGLARLVLSIIGLLIVFIPFRKSEPWAFAALCTLIFVYEIPVFVFGAIPNLGTWPIFQNWSGPRAVSLGMYNFSRLLYAVLPLVGIALAVPGFLKSKRSSIKANPLAGKISEGNPI